MTGENFKWVNRHNTKLEELKAELQNVKTDFTGTWKKIEYNYRFDGNEDINKLHENIYKLEKRIERLEYLIYCTEYEDNRRRNWN
jgi:peptidoglycan hydrolase CwlO-like protein